MPLCQSVLHVTNVYAVSVSYNRRLKLLNLILKFSLTMMIMNIMIIINIIMIMSIIVMMIMILRDR